jgi:hypothetical protein
LVQVGERGVTFRGRVRTYDVLDPLSWPAAAVAGPRLASAATRFSLKNARFFAGYAVDARRVPFAWSPPGRLFARIELTAGRVLELGTGKVLDGWGEWPSGVRYETASAPIERVPGLDRRVPSRVRTAVGAGGMGALALQARSAVSVLPVAWRRVGDAYEMATSARIIGLSRADRRAPAALTISHASSWRAADMAGMLIQGSAQLYSPRSRRGGASVRKRLEEWGETLMDDAVLVRLRPFRVVWWEGWTSGTVKAS